MNILSFSILSILKKYGTANLFTALALCMYLCVQAQTDYSAWQQIYSDANITISIANKEGTVCNGGDRVGKYKYKLSGSLDSYTKTLYVTNSYADCNGSMLSKQDAINIGKGGAMGEVESLGYTYKGKAFKNIGASLSASGTPLPAPSTGTSAGSTSAGSTSSGDTWGTWMQVYADNSVTVHVRYKISSSACTQGGLQHKYKFKIDGTLHSTTCLLPIKVEYTTCQSYKSENNHKLNIGTGGTLGEVESIDYRYAGIGMGKCTAASATCTQPAQQQWQPPAPSVHTSAGPVPYIKPRRNPAMWGMWFKLGADMGTRPMIANYTYTQGAASIQRDMVINPFALGARADLVYTPIYVRGFSLTMNVGGAYGTGVLALIKTKPKSKQYPAAETEGSQSYTYYKVDAGAELAFGWEQEKKAFLVLVKYQYHINIHKYNSNINYAVATGLAMEDVAASPSLARETIYGGFRFKPNTAKLSVDLTFQLSRDFLWNWNIANRIAAGNTFQYGGGILFRIQSKRVSGFDCSVDIATNAAPASGFQNVAEGKRIFSRVNILYTIGGRKAYKHK